MARVEEMRIGVIGSGLGGLAAACTLAARGHRVVLCEKNAWLGGKAAVLAQEGFRFDMGPTILTMPSVLRRIFAEAGKSLEERLDLVPLDPQWRCFFAGGATLDLTAGEEDMARRIADLAGRPGPGQGYRRFLRLAEKLHRLSGEFFFWRSIGGLKDMFDLRRSLRLSTLADVLTMRWGWSVAGTIRSFVGEPRAAQMLDHYTQYVGSDPYQAPAVLCGIASMQTHEGVWYPRGGTRAVPEALARLAGELGVEIRSGEKVVRIHQQGGRAAALETERGERLPVEAVVAAGDSVRTHQELLDGAVRDRFRRRRRYEPACSGIVLYLGLKEGYGHLLHHNFVFSRDPEEEFAAIYRRGEPAPDPTCYLACPARTEPEVAPPGGEALYVLVHTPWLRPGQEWSRLLPDYRRVVLDKLKETAGLTDLEDRIVTSGALTPEGIRDRYWTLEGAIYGLASHGRLQGAFKPANRSPDLPGLYLAGGSAHPGPGMPMALMSGWIAADTLDRDLKAGRAGR